MNPSRLHRLVSIALAVLAAGGCRRNDAVRARLVMGVSALRISQPVFVAAERGLFARHGLDVELRSYVTAQPMVDDVVLGRIDAAGYAAYPIVLLSARGAARPPRMVTSLVEDKEHRLSYVLSRKGSKLRFPADARGRRIGILPTVAYQKWLDAILGAAGIAPREVTVVPIAPPLEASALPDGVVDLLFTGDPMASAALAAGEVEIADDGPPCAARLGDPFFFGGFVLSAALADQQPEVAERLVAALDDAIAEVRADPSSARRAMLGFVRPEEEAWIDRYPVSRYLRSSEVPANRLDDEAIRERALGIVDLQPTVVSWSPSRRR